MDEIEWWEFDTPAELASQAAGDIAFVIESAIAAHKGARLALGTGGAADAVLKALAADKTIDWSKVTLVPTDEPIGGGGTLAKLFAKKGATLVSLADGASEAPAAARAAEARLADLQWPLDLVLLTAGADGRIAGISPGPDVEAAVAGPRGRRVLGTRGDDDVARVTLTADAITTARAVILVVTGAEARATVEQAIEQGPLARAPVGRVLASIDVAMDIFWTA